MNKNKYMLEFQNRDDDIIKIIVVLTQNQAKAINYLISTMKDYDCNYHTIPKITCLTEYDDIEDWSE